LGSFSINLSSPPHALLDACKAMQLTAQTHDPLSATIVFWEASSKAPGTLNAQQAAHLNSEIQHGRSLLLTLNEFPGVTPPLLGNLLPTTGWATQPRLYPISNREPLRVMQVDSTFFGEGLEGMAVPYCFDIRSTSAVERGQARYERYSFVHPMLHIPIPAGSDTWSRSLLNREWIVRAQCNDLAQMPLVVTGRYGGGKVAMVASSADGIGDSAAARQFWTAMLRWLMEGNDSKELNIAKPDLSVSFSGGKAQVTLRNPSSTVLPLQVVLRVLAADGAILADGAGDLVRKEQLAPRHSSTLEIRLPAPSPTADEGVLSEKPLHVRVGVLSGNGATLLAEERVATPPPALRLRVQTDNLYSIPYPFHAPGPDVLAPFQGRMGAYVGAYAYAPGQSIRGTVILSNGLENLAPFSAVQDLTTRDNESVMALKDEATGIRRGPSPDKIQGYSMWTGKAGVENVLQFTLPDESFAAAAVIVGSFGKYVYGERHNPGQVVIETDGRRVAAVDNLDEALALGCGQARVSFQRSRVKTIKVRFPWVAKQDGAEREEPWLGEIRIEGWRGNPPPHVSGRLTLHLVDSLGGEHRGILNTTIAAAGCGTTSMPFKVDLPNSQEMQFYTLEAKYRQTTASTPVLLLQPSKALLPITDLLPPDCAGVGFNVSRGFRNVSHLGTGTAEPWGGWGTPDDLVWAYSRQLKQIPLNAPNGADRLYVANSDMRHYITPWRSFSNGELFMPAAAPMIVENLKHDRRWSRSNVVHLQFADRWDTGPDLSTLHGWQDFVEFDRFLRATTGAGLTERTHLEVGKEIEGRFMDQWVAWQLQRYVTGVTSLREAFQSAGKSLVITAQGVPMVTGEAGRELALTIRGMSDDCTWSMLDNSPVLTTGRQMSELAFNPVWKMATLVPWGFNSALFNDWQWHNPVGTTEPSRRHMYDRAWRGTLSTDGLYGSLYTYGYTGNVGIAYTMTEEDYQQFWYMQERHSLIAPEEPLGAGLIISTSRSSDPKHIRFTCGDPLTLDEPRLLTQSFRNLHNAGISLPFAANAASLRDCIITAPLILLNLADFSDDEVETLRTLHARGTRLAAFAERSRLSAAASGLFSQPGTVLLEFSPDSLSRSDALDVAARLQAALHLPLQFPQGIAGYGFRSTNTTFVVIEDWLEKARQIELRIAKSNGVRTAAACNINDHQPLTVRDGGAFWMVDIPLRSGDGVLVALRESGNEP
jgi:hypothetical protein